MKILKFGIDILEAFDNDFERLVQSAKSKGFDAFEYDGDLDLDESRIYSLPDNLSVNGFLGLARCYNLTSLPNNLSVEWALYLRNTHIKHLPDDISVGGSLMLSNSNIESLPDNLLVNSALDLAGCQNLISLPDNLSVGGNLDLFACKNLTSLPDNLTVGGWLDIRETQIETLPASLKVKIRILQ